MRLLIVDSPRADGSGLVARLRAEGHHVAVSDAVQDLPARVLTERIRLVLLDAALLRGQCLVELCRILRQESSVLLLLLGQADAPSERILALEAGGDLWLAQPVTDDDLLAQIHALLRRHPLNVGRHGPERLRVTTDLAVDLASQKLVGAGQANSLTDREFRLLTFLLRHEGAILSREALLNAVWGMDEAISDREVDVYVRYLRRKVEPDPLRPRYLLTVWGRGYQYLGPPPPRNAGRPASSHRSRLTVPSSEL
ncbi:MAG: response regulator transcription factor [Chloroflexota bacterium]